MSISLMWLSNNYVLCKNQKLRISCLSSGVNGAMAVDASGNWFIFSYVLRVILTHSLKPIAWLLPWLFRGSHR